MSRLSLDAAWRMDRVKTVFRIGGICVCIAGLACLPVVPYTYRTWHLSAVTAWRPTGALAWVGLVLLGVGAVMLLASVLVPGELTD